MCGIAGIVTTDDTQSAEFLSARVKAMTDRIVHRGPDGEGLTQAMPCASGGHAVLGHRRLSIVDIAGGAQPMTCKAGNIWLTFNGEIYNFPQLRDDLINLGYEFDTLSDTEVVLTAYRHYGQDCVKLFNGMFSLAIWDCAKSHLFAARDAYGKKPFYYRLNEDGFQFASEIKAFAGHKATPCLKLNEDALPDCTLLRYAPGETTLYSDILKLEPGTCATYDPAQNTLKKFQFYIHPDSQPRASAPGVSLAAGPLHEQFLTLLDDSVAARLNCDVPFGAFLSGGIDSTVIVALMSRHMPMPVKTFSVGFEQKNLSELDSARLVADTFGTDHHEKVIKPEDFISYLPDAIFFRDGPVSEPSDIPILLLSRLASEKVKMVLTGEGSDEVLGGYPKHVYEKYAGYSAVLPQAVKKALRASVRTRLPAKQEKIKCALNSLLADNTSSRMQRWFGSSDIEIRNRLHGLADSSNSDLSDNDRFLYRGGSPLRNILAFDQSVWLPNNLLERGDRMTMAASLEARMPFLDTRLAGFVSQLPDKHRVNGRKTKWILRQAANRIIPEKIIKRKKLGFKVPIEEWFRSSLSDYLHELIVAPGASLHEYMAADVVTSLFDEHQSAKQNHEKILWSLLNMEIWLRQINDAGPGRHVSPSSTTDQVSIVS